MGDVVKLVIAMDDKASAPVKKLSTQTEKLGKSAKKTGTNYAELGGKLVAFAMAAKGAAVMIHAFTQGVADNVNQLSDLSTATGLSTKTIAGLKLAAEGAGLEIDNLKSVMMDFPKRMSEMARGSGEAKIAFEKLGISVTDSDGNLRDANEVLKESISKLQALESSTERAALQTILFGGAGADLMVALSGAELEEFITHAERFGIDVGPKAAASAADYQREMAALGMAADKAAQTIGRSFGGERAGATGAIKGFGIAITFVGNVFAEMINGFRKGLNMITQPLTDFFILSGEVMDALELKKSDPAAAAKKVEAALRLFKSGIAEAFEDPLEGLFVGPAAVKKAWNDAKQAMEAATPGLSGKGGTGSKGGTGGAAAATATTASTKELETQLKALEAQFGAVSQAIAPARTQSQELQAAYDGLSGATLELLQKAASAGAGIGKLNNQIDEFVISVNDPGAIFDSLRAAIEAAQKAEAEAIDTQVLEVEAALGAALETIATSIQQIPAVMASKVVTAIGDPAGAITGALGPAGGLISGISALGEKGAGAITKEFKGFITGFITGLVNVLPKLIVSIPRAIINAVPDLISGIFKAIPQLLSALFVGLPRALLIGMLKWWRRIKKTIKSWFTFGDGKGKDRREARRERRRERRQGWQNRQTGGRIFETGPVWAHAGEYILPTSGANSQDTAGIMKAVGGGGGQTIHIHTNVVDPNAIESLGRLLNRHFGSFGNSTNPLFSGT